uniref:Uncharacterized protein n=1 Tax=Anopheles coluzzii TaxID=1518534 RepID=A0A8W7PXL1_ANOCL
MSSSSGLLFAFLEVLLLFGARLLLISRAAKSSSMPVTAPDDLADCCLFADPLLVRRVLPDLLLAWRSGPFSLRTSTLAISSADADVRWPDDAGPEYDSNPFQPSSSLSPFWYD